MMMLPLCETFIFIFWSRSRFTSQAICDTLVNNMSEAFNSVIIDARTKPIVSMLEDIRIYLMKRWAKNRKKVKGFKGSICPRITTRLREESALTKNWIPRYLNRHFDTINIYHLFNLLTCYALIVGQEKIFLKSSTFHLLERSTKSTLTHNNARAGNGCSVVFLVAMHLLQ